MLSDMYVIDGCAFAEEDFTGVTQKVKDSPLTAFFLTTPGEDQGMLALPITSAASIIWRMTRLPG